MRKTNNFFKNLIFSALFFIAIFLSIFNFLLIENSKSDLETISLLNEMEASIEKIKFITLFHYLMFYSERNFSYELDREFSNLRNIYEKINELADKEVRVKLNDIFKKNIRNKEANEEDIISSYENEIINLNQLIEKTHTPLRYSIKIFNRDILPNPNIPLDIKKDIVDFIYSIMVAIYSDNNIKDENLKKIFLKISKSKYSNIKPIKEILNNFKYIIDTSSIEVLKKDMKIYIQEESLTLDIEKLRERIRGEYEIQKIIFNTVSIGIIFTYTILIIFLYIAYISSKRKARELIKIKEELENIVEKDELTDLGNRLAFLKDKNQMRDPSLILLNIDNFKQVNESYGTDAGDFILRTLAQSIKDFLSKEGLDGKVYRLGADDFGILFEDYKDKIKEITEKLIKYIENKPFKYKDIYIPISVSAGIALSRPLFEKADIALRFVRKTRQKYAVYTDDMNIQDKIVNRINIIKTIKKALQEEDGIFLVYQPIENLKTGQIEKYEVLVRMIDEKGRILYPGEFLEIAKESKLYGEITKKVLEKTFKTLENYDVELSVNLSIEDIVDENIRLLIRKHIKSPSLASRLTFEILEDVAIEEYKREFKEFIDEMKSFGVNIAIDDFGSGYSNFAHLLTLKPDFIKVDGSLIKEIDVVEKNRLITETIVSFCKKLGIKTVAEFVWNRDVYETVKKIGFDYGQGFYISKPLTKLPEEKRKKEED